MTVNNVQIAYVLGGVTRPPLSIGNRRFVMLGPQEPKQDEWLRFERDLHSDFKEHYGKVPTRFSKLRVLFEVRFDGRSQTEPETGARVYYDDLYLGP